MHASAVASIARLPSAQGGGSSAGEGCEAADKLTFLVEMFNRTEAALVADVFRACNGDPDAAMQSLMDMQARASAAGGQAPPCCVTQGSQLWSRNSVLEAVYCTCLLPGSVQGSHVVVCSAEGQPDALD